MYNVLCDSYLLYDVIDSDYKLIAPTLSEELNKVASFSFTIYDNHPNFSRLKKLESEIEVKKDNKTIFKGRIINDSQNFDNSIEVECESVLAYLLDTVIEPYDFTGRASDLMIKFITEHNAQASERQQFKIGTLTGGNLDNNDYIVRSNSDYQNTWDAIKDKLLNIGGYLSVRYEEDGNYIDWVDDFTTQVGDTTALITSAQTIEFGENLLDLIAENNAEDTYTVCLPLGAEVENADGTKSRIDVTSVNNGSKYVINEAARAKYGWIVAPIKDTTWNDVTLPSNLLRKATDLLNNSGVMMKSKITASAIDLNVVDKDIDSFGLGQYLRLQSTPHGLSGTYLLTKKETTLDAPEDTKITLGEEEPTLTGVTLGNLNNKLTGIEENITIIQQSVDYFAVDLSGYSLVVPVDSLNKPITPATYEINHYAYFKGKQVIPTISVNDTHTGITVTTDDTKLTFAVTTTAAIPNAINEYEITFNYEADGKTYTTSKTVTLVITKNGADGTSVTILGSYGSLEALKIEHPTGDLGDSYIINGDLYIWNGTEWDNVGTIQGPKGEQGERGPQGLQGPQGEQGLQGPVGAAGQSSYFHVKYSAVPNPTASEMTETPNTYIGTYVDFTAADSTNPDDYTWVQFQGSQGPSGQQGIPGKNGVDGTSTYLHIKYSNDGKTFTANGGETVGTWMGTLIDHIEADSTTFGDYKWAKIKGEDGQDGQNGVDGKDGISITSVTAQYAVSSSNTTAPTSGWGATLPNRTAGQYLWVRDLITYSDTTTATVGARVVTGDKGDQGATGISITKVTSYFAVGTNNTTAPSSGWQTTPPTRGAGQYLWRKDLITFSNGKEEYTTAVCISGDKGDKGEQGIQGPAGANGVSYYFYVRYSANANGNPMTTTPTGTTKYMGVASTTDDSAPTSYAAYTWTLIKGADGADGNDGAPGAPGADGRTSYLHIKYSNDGETFTENNGEILGSWIGTLVDFTEDDSTNFDDYTWKKFTEDVDEELNEIRQEIVTNTALIEQTNETIAQELETNYVSKGYMDTYEETVNSRLAQTSEDISLTFSSTVSLIEDLDGETQAAFRELEAYFRGYMNEAGQPVAELGSSESKIILRVTNDRISFTQNGAEVAYISDDTLYITDGQFLNSLRIGNFAYIPRANGSLDFKKVVG